MPKEIECEIMLAMESTPIHIVQVFTVPRVGEHLWIHDGTDQHKYLVEKVCHLLASEVRWSIYHRVCLYVQYLGIVGENDKNLSLDLSCRRVSAIPRDSG